MTFLRTAHQQGVDAIALLVDLARAPEPRRRRRALPAVRLNHSTNRRSATGHSSQFTPSRMGIQVRSPLLDGWPSWRCIEPDARPVAEGGDPRRVQDPAQILVTGRSELAAEPDAFLQVCVVELHPI